LFEQVFPLKKNASTSVYVNLPVHDNVHVSTSSSIVKDSIDEPRRSKRCRVEISFGLDLLAKFLIEDTSMLISCLMN